MRRIHLVAPVLLLVLAGASACAKDSGGGPSAKGVGASPAAGGTFEQFASCMREHGQNVPDRDSSGNVELGPPATGDRTAWDAAMRACQQYMPGGGGPVAPDPQELEGLRQYAACMREHGIEVSDPDPTTGKSQIGGRLANASRDQITNDPTYKAADAACKDKLVDPPKGGGK
jgi:hypothetical protein